MAIKVGDRVIYKVGECYGGGNVEYIDIHGTLSVRRDDLLFATVDPQHCVLVEPAPPGVVDAVQEDEFAYPWHEAPEWATHCTTSEYGVGKQASPSNWRNLVGRWTRGSVATYHQVPQLAQLPPRPPRRNADARGASRRRDDRARPVGGRG